jgi:hypothetical protein
VSGGYERLACASQRRPQRLDGTQIGGERGCKVRAMTKRQVNNTIRCGSSSTKTVEVINGPATHLSPNFL